MAYTANLRLKGGRFHFRRKIPYNLRARFGRSEIVRSLQTGERRTAAIRARVVWLEVESVFEQVLAQPTLGQEEIDGLVRKAAADVAWADEVRFARSGTLFSHHGDAPWDADAILLESDAFDYRESLARNDVTSVQTMARRYLDEAGFAVPAGGLDETLVGRALLRLLAQTSEDTADRLRREVYPFTVTEEARNGDQFDEDLEAACSWDGEDPTPECLDEAVSEIETVDDEAAPLSSPTIKIGSKTFDEAWSDTILDLKTSRGWDDGRAAHADSSRKL